MQTNGLWIPQQRWDGQYKGPAHALEFAATTQICRASALQSSMSEMLHVLF